METLKKYVTGKNLQIMTLIGTAFTIMMFIMSSSIGSSTESISSFSDIGGLISSLKTFCNIFYLDFFVVLAATAGYAFRIFYEKDTSLSIKVLTPLNGIACLFGLICFSTIHSIKAGLSGDFASLLQLGDIEGQFSILRIMLLIQIAAGIAAAYFLFYKKNRRIGEEESDKENQEASDHESIVDQVKAYYATEKGKRNIRIGGAAVAVFIVLLVIVNVYESNRRTEIDLTSACAVTFEGVSGNGSANIHCSPDYDHNNENIASFMSNVSYTIDNDGRLENGMEVTLKANYSEATAESSKINPVKTSKKFKVKGLEIAYRDFADIPKKVSNEFEAAAKAFLEKDIQSNVNGLFGYDTITVEDAALIGIYYKYTSYNNSGTAYYIFRTKETRERSSDTSKEVNYYSVILENISSSYKLDLSDESKDMIVDSLSIYEKDKTDAKALKQFTRYHSDVETVKTNPGSEIYKDERIKKEA
ncbi:hypothetical protein GSF08_01110 [Clostridiaceae bacterium DONG20-135]|uniref:Uncharacterized protein n=1 Tax=Copranaerobaculum intestinale TaxID=2692629 RepID=A0A6N8U2V5_9FIRM|nr:hypothetical protein [Copranaerobaculum intestinale]MXQ72542.1 hypothetical protein [Copranaerobaculum intestinale]